MKSKETNTMPRAKAKPATSLRSRRVSVTSLYKRFERARAAMMAISKKNDPRTTRLFSLAVEKCDKIAGQVVTLPANSIMEMMLKIRVAGWCTDAAVVLGNRALKPWFHSKHKLEDLDNWKPDPRFQIMGQFEQSAALVSLREDLRRILKMGLFQLAPGERFQLVSHRPNSRGES